MRWRLRLAALACCPSSIPNAMDSGGTLALAAVAIEHGVPRRAIRTSRAAGELAVGLITASQLLRGYRQYVGLFAAGAKCLCGLTHYKDALRVNSLVGLSVALCGGLLMGGVIIPHLAPAPRVGATGSQCRGICRPRLDARRSIW